jgi:magnesium transporter
MAPTTSDIDLSDPVTAHMRRDFVQFPLHQTVGEALAGLRARPPEGQIIYFYVVDPEGRLEGVVPTRRLLLNPLDKPLAEIMVRPVITIPATASVLEACEFFIMHRLLAFPVVDDQRRMIGVVDVNLYTEELVDLDRREEHAHLFQLIGVHLTEAQQHSPVLSFRYRFPWLLCNITAGILAALLSKLYEDAVALVAVAVFIPVVLALAESVAIQSVSLALQALQGQKPTWSLLAAKARREVLTGLLLGAASGLVVGAVAMIWLGEVRLLGCLLGGIAGGVAGAAVFGLGMPYVLRLLRLDPQVAAGPIALAAADMLTLLLYFNLARWLLV